MLPQLFEMDSYADCFKNNNLFCKVRARMTTFQNDTLKEYVKNLTKDMDLYDRSLLHRGLCITKPQEWHENYDRAESEKIINQRLEDFQLTTNVEYIKCTDGNVPITFYDYFILFIIIIYSTFVAFSTYYERRQWNGKKQSGIQGLMMDFSIFSNWKKKMNLSNNEDYQKLLSIQGVRVVTMILVIVSHAFVTNFYIYLSNPTELELIMKRTLPSLQIELCRFVVLNFFLISSWIQTIQVNDTVKRFGKLSLKQVGMTVLKRYLRFQPTAIFIVILYSTSWPVKILGGPLNFDLIQEIQEACRTHFIYDLLFLQNFLWRLDMCNNLSWFLAADFQVFVINAVVLYIWFKFKFNMIKYFTTVFVTSLAIYGTILYSYNLNGSYTLKLRDCLMYISGSVKDFTESMTYVTPYSIFPGSFIGIIFGMIYIKCKNKALKTTPFYSVLWFLCLFGLPPLAALIYTLDMPRIPSALLGSMTKAIYCLGLAIGIFGMIHNLGGKLKKCLEHRYVAIAGNFSFCVYICHWMLIFSRFGASPRTMHFLTTLTDVLVISLKACVFGVILSLTVEEPWLAIRQRLFETKKSEVPKEQEQLISF